MYQPEAWQRGAASEGPAGRPRCQQGDRTLQRMGQERKAGVADRSFCADCGWKVKEMRSDRQVTTVAGTEVAND